MTNTADRSTFRLQGNGATTNWDFTFQMQDTSDIILHTYVTETREYTLVDSADYTVTIYEDGTGYVTYPLAGDPIPVGTWVHGFRVTERTQGTDYTNQRRFYADVLEGSLDRLEAQVQEIGKKADSAAYTTTAQLPLITDPLEDRAIILNRDGAMKLGPTTDEIAHAQSWAELARAWAQAEEGTHPDPDDATSESARTWAGRAADSADLAETYAQAPLYLIEETATTVTLYLHPDRATVISETENPYPSLTLEFEA